MCAQLVTIKGNPYIGLQRNSYLSEEEKENNHQVHKSILIFIEAWNTVICQASPGLLREVKRIQPKPAVNEPKNSILHHQKKVDAEVETTPPNQVLNNCMQPDL